MKTLYIIRHAKSSWENVDLDDFDRPLNDRGRKDAPRMGKRLKEKDVHPNLMISSPANRALTTCKHIGQILGYPEKNIKTERKLYHASTDTILSVLQKLDDSCQIVMLFGHNPGLTDFVNEIGREVYIDNIPTCGIVCLSFNINSWKDLNGNQTGALQFFDYPKSKND